MKSSEPEPPAMLLPCQNQTADQTAREALAYHRRCLPPDQSLPGSERLPRQSVEAIRRLLTLLLSTQWTGPRAQFYLSREVSAASFCRWRQAFLRDGLAGLVPHTFHCGRKPINGTAKNKPATWVLVRPQRLLLAHRALRTASKQLRQFLAKHKTKRKQYL
ncbi:MAG: hypothetical protein MUF81_21250 [Verrucomicrobia bacterium]|jgi:hypothetical protein|nr:hypothetical protein [Verrucomicrobiota bacterium]